MQLVLWANLDYTISEFNAIELKKIHRYLFGDLYDFAGEFRKEDIAKGNTNFCHFEYIEKELKKLFLKLLNEEVSSLNDISKIISHYYSELNFIYPFRGGNSRTNRLFFSLYARFKNYMIDFSGIDKDELLEAIIYAYVNDESKLNEIFKNIIYKV